MISFFKVFLKANMWSDFVSLLNKFHSTHLVELVTRHSQFPARTWPSLIFSSILFTFSFVAYSDVIRILRHYFIACMLAFSSSRLQ